MLQVRQSACQLLQGKQRALMKTASKRFKQRVCPEAVPEVTAGEWARIDDQWKFTAAALVLPCLRWWNEHYARTWILGDDK